VTLEGRILPVGDTPRRKKKIEHATWKRRQEWIALKGKSIRHVGGRWRGGRNAGRRENLGGPWMQNVGEEGEKEPPRDRSERVCSLSVRKGRQMDYLSKGSRRGEIEGYILKMGIELDCALLSHDRFKGGTWGGGGGEKGYLSDKARGLGK